MRREDRHGRSRDERSGVVCDAIDIARNQDAGATSNSRGGDRGVFVQVVHMEKTRMPHDRIRNVIDSHCQLWIAMPYDCSVAVSFVNQDDGMTIRSTPHRGMRQVDSSRGERVTRTLAVGVVSKRADISRSQSKRCACGK